MNRFLHIITITLLLCIAVQAFSQDYQKEINDQVWKPFISTFSNRDTQGFMAVHSKDLVRAPRDSKSVSNFDQYKQQNEAGDKRAAERDMKRSIDLRFLERMASKDQAYEVGIYKTTMTNAKGESKSFYGKFHVVLRKENNVWKILVDSDSSEGNTISEKDFLAALPMEQ
jgi:ketosteroid isomerase-like protein